MFWFVLLIVGIALSIIGLCICDRSGFNDANLITGSVLSVTGFLVCLASIILLIAIPIEIAKMKEISKNKKYFTSLQIDSFNSFVANTKTYPLLFWGYNLDGIEYVNPSDVGGFKVEKRKMKRFFKKLWINLFGPKECHHIGGFD